jgi:TP901 family phage tail tape measure protein/lambda family phage tail tape measure protein
MDRDLTFSLSFVNKTKGAIEKDLKQAALAAKQVEKAGKDAARGLTRMGTAAKFATSAINRGSRGITRTLNRIRILAFQVGTAIAGIGLGFGLTRAITTVRDFELAIARVDAITESTTAQFRALNDTARALGAVTQFRASQVADGLRLLAQAGFNAQESIAAIGGTLDLAIAGVIDLNTATGITSNTIRAFSLNASQAGEVADVLALTAARSNTNIFELGEAMKFVAPAAASAGISIKDTAAAIGTLANAGLKGTLAGTGIRRVIIGLINPTKEGSEAFERMGLNIRDLDPRLRSLRDIFEELSEKGFGASEAFEAFGLRGGPAAIILADAFATLQQLNDELEKSEGFADSAARRIEDTLNGAILRLQSAFEELILSQGAFQDSLRDVVQFLTQVVRALNNTINLNEDFAAAGLKTAKVIRVVGNAILFLFRNIGKILVVLLAAKAAFIGFSTAAAIASTATKGFAAAAAVALGATGAGGLLLLIGGLTAAWVAYNSAVDEAELKQEALNNQLEDAQRVLDSVRGRDAETRLANAGAVARSIEQTEEAIKTETLIRSQAIQQIAEAQRAFDRINNPRGRAVAGQRLEELKGRAAEANSTLIELQDTLRALQREQGLSDKFQDRITESGRRTAEFQKALRQSFETISRVSEVDTQKSQKAIEDLTFKVNQLKLGTGEAADAQRKINAEIRGAGLDETPEEFDRGRVEATRLITEAQTRLNKARETGEEKFIKDAEKSLGIAQDTLKTIEGREQARKQELVDLRRLAAQEAELTRQNKLAEDIEKQRLARLRNFQKFQLNQLAKIREENILLGVRNDQLDEAKAVIALVTNAAKNGQVVTQEGINQLIQQIELNRTLQEERESFAAGFRDAVEAFIDETKNMAEQAKQIFEDVVKGLEDVFVQFVQTGEASFSDLLDSFQEQLLRRGFRNLLGSVLGSVPGFQTAGKTTEQVAVEQLQGLRADLEKQRTFAGSTKDLVIINNSIRALDLSLENLTGTRNITGQNQSAFLGPALGFAESLIAQRGGVTSGAGPATARGSAPLGAFIGAARARIGGITQAGRQAAGLGPDEIPAILHPGEAVVPLDRAGRIPLTTSGGKVQVRLPGGRLLPTAASSPLNNLGIRQAVSGVEAIKGRGPATGENPLAFLGAPRAQAGLALASFFRSVGSGILGAGGALAGGLGSLVGIGRSAAGSGFFGSSIGLTGGGLLGGLGALLGVGGRGGFGSIGLTGGGLLGAGANLLRGDVGAAGGSILSGFGEALGIGATGATGGGILGGIQGAFEQLGFSQAGRRGVTALGGTSELGAQAENFGNIQRGFSDVGRFLGVGGEGTPGGLPISNVSTGRIPRINPASGFSDQALSFIQSIPGIGPLFEDGLAKGTENLLNLGQGLAGLFTDSRTRRSSTTSIRRTGRRLGFGGDGAAGASLTPEDLRLLGLSGLGRELIKLAGTGIVPFQQGGVVSAPTLALLGEGGAPEAVVPLRNGQIPVQVRGGGGSRGRQIVNNITFNVVTPDADSFRENQAQIHASLAATLERQSNRR